MKNLKIRERKKKKSDVSSEVAAVSVPQTYDNSRLGLSSGKYVGSENDIYESLRESIPVIDSAIEKLTRLTGGFSVRCKSQRNEKLLSDFLSQVNVGGNSKGIESFISSYFDELLTYGTSLGEIVLNPDRRSFSLYNAELDGITLRRHPENPLFIQVCTSANGSDAPVKNQSSLLLSTLNPKAGQLSGNSLLKGLPFVSSVLMQIFESTGTNWERMGNLRYSVTYRPQNDALDKTYARERAMQIAKEWSDAMKSGGTVKDFIAVGDVDIKVIGSDSQVLDSEVPVRQMLEQIIAKTGLPPFMFGLNWSTSERMAKQQTDLLTSELWYYRRILTPVIVKIADTYLRLLGISDECTVEWEDISLLDEVEEAKARYYGALSEKYTAEAAAVK